MINEKYYHVMKDYQKKIQEVIERGPYKDNWESLSGYKVPDWLEKSKFGIFIHWGIYSVPAYGDEWYPTWMYQEGRPEYEHHIKTYGPHKNFGYKDFIPLFRGEKFSAKEWVELFKKAGAKYVMPVAEHHDGFQMYESNLSNFNSVEMGPCRDVLKELKEELEQNDMVFTVSSHRMEHLWYFGGGLAFDSDVRDERNNMLYGGCYGPCLPFLEDRGSLDAVTLDNPDFMEDWMARTCELVDRYHPRSVYFDWWIESACAKPYLKKFAAYYYNRALEWGIEVAIHSKYDSYVHSSSVFDIERGQLNSIYPRTWQTDTAIAKKSWGYTVDNEYKEAREIICDLVDIVSKNGCMLLNVGPKADGTITEEETQVLLEIGRWLEVNGEGIYNSTYWKLFGEGPTQILQGTSTDDKRSAFTCEDIRYTYRAGYLYAFVMQAPENGEVIRLRNLKKYKYTDNAYQGLIEQIDLLGFDNPFEVERLDEFMEIRIQGKPDTNCPICFRFKLL